MSSICFANWLLMYYWFTIETLSSSSIHHEFTLISSMHFEFTTFFANWLWIHYLFRESVSLGHNQFKIFFLNSLFIHFILQNFSQLNLCAFGKSPFDQFTIWPIGYLARHFGGPFRLLTKFDRSQITRF